MEKQTDDQVAVSMVEKSQARFPNLRAVSFDKGFHSPANRQALEERLELVALPKKGRHSAADSERENAPAFIKARRKHSAVESAINGLEILVWIYARITGFQDSNAMWRWRYSRGISIV
jgi:IS5 family transposase